MSEMDTKRTQEVQQQLVDFIQRDVMVGRTNTQLTIDAPLLGNVLDSLDALRLVSFVEETFGVDVLDGDLGPETFGSVRTLAEYVARQTAGTAGGRAKKLR